MTEFVDALAVARSLRRLDAVAAAHPEIVDHAAPMWTSNLDDLAAAIDLEIGDTMSPRKTKTKAGASAPVVAFRLEPELLARLDAHATRMTEATPGVTYTRADALRTLLIRALNDVEVADKWRK
jgi:hypothetical protein